MRDTLRDHLFRLALTLLLASGLLMPLLGALSLEGSIFPCLLVCGALALGLEALSVSRRAALWGGLAAVIILLLWLANSGAAVLRDVLRAFSLQLAGVSGALPLVAVPAARLLGALITLLAFCSTRRSAGALGASLLTIGALLMLWLADRPDLMLPLLPAGIAALALYLLDRHAEASPARVLPWAAALVLLAYACTPPSGLVNPTLKSMADEFRQNVMDRLFFTEPRDVFSLSSEGFYPQGLSQLGGPVSPSDHAVMQVSTPRTVYLRGVILNEYDGRSWRNTLGGRRYLWDASSMASRRASLFDQHLPSTGLSSTLTDPLSVSIRMLTDSASTLFAPQRVRELRAGGDLVPYFSNSSELFITRNLTPGDTWSLSAPLFQAGDAGLSILIEAASTAGDPQYESIRETYTTLPSHLEEPVWQLATDVTEGIASPYEKAFALQNYLSRNYRYTLDAAVQPASIDFVTHFLFNTREGYCTYFASAMTVLCRMAGLPARYVEGYLATPNAQGEALVTGLDAHAWTEVYFQGFGWLTFDATPRRAGGNDGSDTAADDSPADPTPSPQPSATPPADTQPTVTPSPDAATVETPSPVPSPAENDPESSPDPDTAPPEEGLPVSGSFPWLLLLLLLPPLALILRWRLTDPSRKEKKLPDEEARFDLWMEEVFARLAAAGLTRGEGETPMSFTRRLDQEGRSPIPLSTLGECISLLHYGHVSAQPTDTALARDTALALRTQLPRAARLKYALHRLLPFLRFSAAGKA